MSSICLVMTNKQLNSGIVFNQSKNTDLCCSKKDFIFDNKNVHFEKNSDVKLELNSFSDCEILLYGCLYNAKQVKCELSDLGAVFSTDSQEEIIITAYKQWSEDCVEKFNGAFCFAIFDKSNNGIFIARDRLGKKNLYYYFEDDNFVVSTELKSFFNIDFIEKEINLDAMGSYLRLGYFPCPYSVLKNVYKIMPGSIVTIKNGALSTKSYWSPLKAYKENHTNKITDYNQAKNELDKLLKICVKERLDDREQIGVFLSSGIDSSLITAIAQNVSKKRVQSVTMGLNNKKYNEAVIAQQIANHLGTDHNEFYVDENDFLEVIKDIPEYYDEPLGDASTVACLMLTKKAKNKVNFIIGGDGGDEIFCGYPRYTVLPKAQKFDFIGEVLDKLLPKSIKKKLPQSIKRVVENRNKKTKSQMLLSADLEKYSKLLKHSFDKPYYEIEEAMGVSDWQTRRMILDMQTSLPDDMIYKVEKAALSAEISICAPILDYRVIEFSFRLPQKFKYDGKITKFILRDLAADYIPSEILNSPKRGFNVPIEDWIRNSLREEFLKYCDKTMLEKQGIFNGDEIEALINRLLNGDNSVHATCWYYYMFQLWYDRYMRL